MKLCKIVGVTLFILTTITAIPVPAAAAPQFIPHPARLSVKSIGTCLTVNTISYSIWDKMYSSSCVLGWDAQKWDINPVGNGFFTIRSHYNQQCLDVYGFHQEDGSAVVTWACNGFPNQQWALDERAGGGFQLRAAHSGKCLNAYSSQPWVVQWRCNAFYTNQVWFISS